MEQGSPKNERQSEQEVSFPISQKSKRTRTRKTESVSKSNRNPSHQSITQESKDAPAVAEQKEAPPKKKSHKAQESASIPEAPERDENTVLEDAEIHEDLNLPMKTREFKK